MSEILLNAKLRKAEGRGASRRLRNAGEIPAIVYGAGKEALSISLDHNTLFYALKKEAFHASILDLAVEGKSEKVVLRDVQMHSFKPQVLHIDFQRVTANEEIHMTIPLHFLGEDESPAIKMQSAHVTHVVNEVEVRAVATNLPQYIEVDLSVLKAGQTIHLSDLILPKGVKLEKLLRGDDAAVVIAGGISEVVETEIVSPENIPSGKGEEE